MRKQHAPGRRRAALPLTRFAAAATFAPNATMVALALGLIAALAPSGSAHAVPMASAGDYDIGLLMEEADNQFDLARQDAVILVEDHAVRIYEDGRRRTTVHRIVWMNTRLALNTYGDLRVPYRADRATLEVETLRTWREGRWWPDPTEVSPTAVVETLPGGLASADDYTTVRETMLLHDGIELPCIVETRYSITEQPPSVPEPEETDNQPIAFAARAQDGLWIFAAADPVMRSVLRLTAPQRVMITQSSRNGAPRPTVEGPQAESPSAEAGQLTYTWSMERVDRIPQPYTDDVLAHAPHVVWSAWTSWEEMGGALKAILHRAAATGQVLRDSLAADLEREPDAGARAEAIRNFIDKWTRPLHYNADFWRYAPRPATRTWETAYGHAYDRAVLAMALFREAGFDVNPFFLSRSHTEIEETIPALAWFDEFLLEVRGADHGGIFYAIYDPAHGSLVDSPMHILGRTRWLLGIRPQFYSQAKKASLVLSLTLEPGDGAEWTGRGYLSARDGFAPYAEMTGLGTETRDHLSTVAGALEGMQLGDYSLTALKTPEVVAGFSVTWDEGETDDHDRIRMTFGDPGGGLLAHLPHDVQLYDEHRDSPVTLPHPMKQRLELRIKIGDPGGGESETDGSTAEAAADSNDRLVYAPPESFTETSVGRVRVTTERKGAWLHLVREIEIDREEIAPEEWADLRALLLQEVSPRSRTILLSEQ